MAVEGGCVGMQIQTTAGKNADPVGCVLRSSEERDEEPEEEGEEDSEFIDEDCDETGERRLRTGCTTGRVVTLQMLLAADILQPGEATMSIEYLGQRFMGDLLSDGKIKSVETDIVFASPSAWAIHCKRIINPEKKSGCGWASVRYKGKKLEIYKTKYFKKRSLDQNKENEATDDDDMELKQDLKTAPVQVPSPSPVPRMVVKHNILGNRSSLHDGNTLVESTPFSSLGKIQPFLVSLSTNAALVMDFHCHLTTSEVVGYLAGHWDVNAHNLAVTHAFPCRSRLSDRESAPLVEAEICKGLEQRHLTLVGWYHSHPYAPATPTLRDIDSQLEYQIRMKGSSDASYTPCIGIICSPYNKESISLESVMISYWVMPPLENKPHEYGKPMLMSYSVVQDNYLSQDALIEMKKCADFYKVEQDYVNFSEKYKSGITYLEKLKNTLGSKFPREQTTGGTLWNYLSELVSPGSTGETQPPPTQNTPATIPTPATPLLLPNNLPITIPSTNKSTSLLGAELASALFASGKFPSPASLMSLSAIFPSGTSVSSSSAPISILKPLISNPSSHVSVSLPLSHSLQPHQSSQYTSSHASTQSLSFSQGSLSHSTQSHSTQSHGTQSHFTLSHSPKMQVTSSNSLHSQATQSHSSLSLNPTHTPQSLAASLVSHSPVSLSLSSLSHTLSLSQASHSSQTLVQSSHSSQTIPQSNLISQSLEKLTQSLSQSSHMTQTLTQSHTALSLSQPLEMQQSPLSLTISNAPSSHTPQSISQTSNPNTPLSTHPSPTHPQQLPSPAKIPKLDEMHLNVCTVTSSSNV